MLLLVGAVLASGRDPLAIVILLVEIVRAVWARNGLRDVRYRRDLVAAPHDLGREIPTAIEVWNRRACRSPGCARPTVPAPA